MDIGYSLRWALAYRLIALLSLLGGVALVAVGFLAGFRGAITTLLANPLDPGPAIAQADPVITLLFCVLAVVVWQFGKTYALFLTLPRATGRAAARRFDPNRVSSAVTADLDERLSAIEDDVAETRRAVAALEGGDFAATYDEDERDGSDSEALEPRESTTETTASDVGADSTTAVGSATDGTGEAATGGSRNDGGDPPAGGAAPSDDGSDWD